MSGFQIGHHRTGHGTYQLTGKKMMYWHEHRTDCECQTERDVIAAHILPAGFRVVGPYNELDGPGLAAGSTDALYAAVSGPRRYPVTTLLQ